VELLFKDRRGDEETALVKFAFLRFESEQEAVKYYLKNKDLKLLSSR
jgi:hypothetical protein